MSEVSELVTYAGAGAAGGGGVGGLLWWLFNRWIERRDARQDRLEDEVKDLREQKVKDLEEQLNELQAAMAMNERFAAKYEEKYENILGWMKKVDANLQAVMAATSKMQGTLEGQAKWLQNINDDAQDHFKNYNIHSPKK